MGEGLVMYERDSEEKDGRGDERMEVTTKVRQVTTKLSFSMC